MNKFDWRVAITAIVCIAGIEVFALHQGFDGALIALVLAAIAGIAGFKLKK